MKEYRTLITFGQKILQIGQDKLKKRIIFWVNLEVFQMYQIERCGSLHKIMHSSENRIHDQKRLQET